MGINLFAYQKSHENHYYEESKNYRRLNNFYLNYYHKLIPDQRIEPPSIIPSSWYKYAREDVDTNTKRQSVRDLMKKWIEWETETKTQLHSYYKQLFDMGEICAAQEILYYLEDVKHELEGAYNTYINLKSTDYDIVYIIDQQKEKE